MSEQEKIAEDRQRDLLRHFPTLLKKWAGSTAKVVELTTSHATLTIRLEHPHRDGNLQLHLSLPEYFRGPFMWADCEIEVEVNDNQMFIARDAKADLEIISECISIKENAKPHHRMIVKKQESPAE